MRSRSADREDYVLRVIRQAAEALRLLRLRLAGAESTASVRLQAAAATDALLGADAPLLARLDAASAVQLVADPRRVALWRGLLDVAAAAAREDGDVGAAAALHDRSRALRGAAAARWPDAGGADDALDPTSPPDLRA